MAYISNCGPTITKKENFDDEHKYLKNCFGIIFPFLVIVGPYWQLWVHFDNFDGPTNAKKEILMAGIIVSKITLE